MPQLQLVLPAKITEFENTRFWIKKQILWLDVSVADAEAMNVGEAAK